MRQKILHILAKKQLGASELAKLLGISRQMAHRHLKVLIKEGLAVKKGKPPRVYYFAPPQESRIKDSFERFKALWNIYKTKRPLAIFNSHEANSNWDLHFLLETSAFYSSKIEGNRLDLSSFLNKAETPKKNKDLKEIEDLKEAYRFAMGHGFSEENLLKAHGILSKNFLTRKIRGRYRESQVAVYSSEGIAYMAIEPQLLPKEMSLFFARAQDLLDTKMTKKETIFWGVYIHLMIALLHPFADGNGRIARMVQKWFLAEKLGRAMWYTGLEKFYFENRSKYYESLQLGPNYWELDFKKAKKFLSLHFAE